MKASPTTPRKSERGQIEGVTKSGTRPIRMKMPPRNMQNITFAFIVLFPLVTDRAAASSIRSKPAKQSSEHAHLDPRCTMGQRGQNARPQNGHVPDASVSCVSQRIG